MKTTVTLLLFLFWFGGAAQTDLPISFTAAEHTSVTLWKEWDFSYDVMKTKMQVDFDGKTLTMQYQNGKPYWSTPVEKYQLFTDTKENEVTGVTYTLTINKDGFTRYIIIEIKKIYETWFSEIKIPHIDKTGEYRGYHYYRD